jgi:hypothetical protein
VLFQQLDAEQFLTIRQRTRACEYWPQVLITHRPHPGRLCTSELRDRPTRAIVEA